MSQRAATLSLPPRTAISPYRNLRPDTTGSEPKDYQIEYLKRKAAGLCTATGCSARHAHGHALCPKHLRLMSSKHKQRYESRARDSLCTYCGERPKFWGLRCIICRQRFAKSLLPSGVRRALRLYREAEQQHEIELSRVAARFAARKLLISGEVTGARAKALRLYVGIDDGRWRTYEEVGRQLDISKECVRYLLKPLKAALRDVWGFEGPWSPTTRVQLAKHRRDIPPKSRSKPCRIKMPQPKLPTTRVNTTSG